MELQEQIHAFRFPAHGFGTAPNQNKAHSYIPMASIPCHFLAHLFLISQTELYYFIIRIGKVGFCDFKNILKQNFISLGGGNVPSHSFLYTTPVGSKAQLSPFVAAPGTHAIDHFQFLSNPKILQWDVPTLLCTSSGVRLPCSVSHQNSLWRGVLISTSISTSVQCFPCSKYLNENSPQRALIFSTKIV